MAGGGGLRRGDGAGDPHVCANEAIAGERVDSSFVVDARASEQ